MEEHLIHAPGHSPCLVRAPARDDYKKMADLATQLRYPSTNAQVRLRLGGMANSSQYAVYVAELPGGQIGGWIGLCMFRPVEQDACAEISGLIVDRRLRSRGIGKRLLEAAERWARSQGSSAISVHSNVNRERAHHFYMGNGYNLVKTQKYLLKTLDGTVDYVV
jgi:GNAT superfamily N-acetyltransferase